VLREAVLALLREDHVAVRNDVELGLCALDCMRVVTSLGQVVREAHGPRVVAASDRAVEDLDACQRRETLHGDDAVAVPLGEESAERRGNSGSHFSMSTSSSFRSSRASACRAEQCSDASRR
jgi:hypothetical protein